jgi:tRNA-specific 2-thiouridylase
MTPKTAIALSGGIDSLVAACLLKEQGHRLLGIHFSTGYESLLPDRIHSVARQLDIPLEILDVSDLFRRNVVDYFVGTYQAGMTPNPCLVCNPVVKFGAVLRRAEAMGAASLATGHYVRVRQGSDGAPRLFRGLDRSKDQSYFLAFLRRSQLSRALFPLGGLTKDAVRRIAAEKGLAPTERRESQDVCFIRDSYGEFLRRTGRVPLRPGPIVDAGGRVIGAHKGLHQFTVGQRRGINCPAKEPYYVLALDPCANRLVVGFKKDLAVRRCRLSGVRWIARPPGGGVRLMVRIRYRHTAVPAVFEPAAGGEGMLVFDRPETAVTPGQGAVFYREDEVLGAGWIERYR